MPPSLAIGRRTCTPTISTGVTLGRTATTTHLRIDQVLLLVQCILAGPEAHALDDGEHARLLAGGGTALELLGLVELGLDGEDGLLDARRLDDGGGRRVQAGQGPLGDAEGGVDAGGVGGLDVMLRDHVERALAAVAQVGQRVLGLVPAAGEADDEERRVVVDDVEVGEGGEVGRRAWLAVLMVNFLGEESCAEGNTLTIF